MKSKKPEKKKTSELRKKAEGKLKSQMAPPMVMSDEEISRLKTALEQKIVERTIELEDKTKEVQLLSDLLNNSSQPFAIGYPDGRFGIYNPALCALIGYSEKEMKTLTWADITPPEWLEPESKKLEELQRTGKPIYYKKEYIRKDGSRVPIVLRPR